VKKASVFKNRLLSLGLITSIILSASGCGKGRKVPGLENFHANVLQSRLYVSFVSTTLQWDAGVTLPIPGLADSAVSVAPDLTSSGTVFQFSVPLASLLHQGKPFPMLGLPDGRPIPDIVGGILPRWDFQIDRLSASAYLSNDVFGLFVPLSFKSRKGLRLPVLVSVEIKDERGNQIGKAYAVPSADAAGNGSGLLILLPYLGGVSG